MPTSSSRRRIASLAGDSSYVSGEDVAQPPLGIMLRANWSGRESCGSSIWDKLLRRNSL
ncbi:MAG TPA: hypothetical protein VHT24_07160 [Pseudacidobacterium sp.]|nr:hypothetical protein [Pseudacidobacterium sp.]